MSQQLAITLFLKKVDLNDLNYALHFITISQAGLSVRSYFFSGRA